MNKRNRRRYHRVPSRTGRNGEQQHVLGKPRVRDRGAFSRYAAKSAGGLFVLLLALPIRAEDLGTAIAYRGFLEKPEGVPVTDTCDFHFGLWSAETEGTQNGALSVRGVAVAEGAFTVELDFGTDAFSGDAHWLEIAVECLDDPGPSLLPRQQLKSSRYALRQAGDEGAPGLLSLTPDENNDDSGWEGDSALAPPSLYWNTTGNAGSTSGNFLGTTDNQSLSLRTNNSTRLTITAAGPTTIATGQRIQSQAAGGARILGSAGNTALQPAIGFFRSNGLDDTNGGNGIFRPTDNTMAFSTRSTERMRITATGAVGIGMTNPTDPLTVNGVIRSTFGGYEFPDGTFQTTAALSGDTTPDTIADDGAISDVEASDVLTINNGLLFAPTSGNVGIGTATPEEKLHVLGNAEIDGTLFADAVSSNSPLLLQTSGTTRIYADDVSGNVGIGTTSPTAKLHLGGTAGVDGIMFPDGTLQTTAAVGGGNGSTLDDAYNEGGPGAGRIITADAGPVEIAGPDGLEVAGTIQSGDSITIDGTARTITSDADIEIHVADGRAQRIESNPTAPNIIAGSEANSVTSGVFGATIGGGGAAGNGNHVSGTWGTISGGVVNTASGYVASVGGGSGNIASENGATVDGGVNNYASGSESTVGGGEANSASGPGATVSGGYTNSAGGLGATVPGGDSNQAGGAWSLAAGRRAKADQEGTFVWADATNADFVSTAANQFLVRAAGGVGINTDSPTDPLTVNGVIRSVTGGYEFPDGTLQSTAAVGGGGTLDEAYNEGGPGAGRIITADAGPVEITGPDGLEVAGTIQSGSSIIIDGTARTITSDANIEVHVADGRALRIESDPISPNIIAGFFDNTVTAGVVGATIAGGGTSSGEENTVSGNWGTISGGSANSAAAFASVGGGGNNTASNFFSTIGGGTFNTASADRSTVSGGEGNTAGDDYSFVGGGSLNTAGGPRSTVAGGEVNTASGASSTVAGGNHNTASGQDSIVAGGASNQAGGYYSFAAGKRAKVRGAAQTIDFDGDEGTFVWADSTNADFQSSGPNQFLIRTAGGMGINTNSPTDPLTVNGVIRSVVGGYEFPDGTIQTTATVGGSGNTLDEAYNEGGLGAGRIITADAGPVEIAGPDGLEVAETIQSGSSITIDGTARTITSDGDIEFHVTDGRALRIESDPIAPNIIAGFAGNTVTPGVIGATISGGGRTEDGIAPPDNNRVIGGFGTIGGGSSNQAASYAVVGGGAGNTAGQGGTIAGGSSNSTSNNLSSIGGGGFNTASGYASRVGGGQGNTASGWYSTIPGGDSNRAASFFSFAAGRRAKADHQGAFAWAD